MFLNDLLILESNGQICDFRTLRPDVSNLTPHLHCTRVRCITSATRFYSVLHAVPTHTRSISEAERLDARDHVICLSDVVFLDFGVSTICLWFLPRILV